MEIGYGNLTIDTYPSGAQIYIDNILILDDNGDPGLTPAILTLAIGYHDIKLTLDSYCNEFGGEYVTKDTNINVFRYFNIC